MKKVLIISYYFPPDPTIGGLRIKGLARYLPEFGWEPIILTKNAVDNSTEKCHIIKTKYCSYDILESVVRKCGFSSQEKVRASFGLSSKKNKYPLIGKVFQLISEMIAYPDEHKSWYKDAVEVGDDFLKNNEINAIISSSSPVTCHLVANSLIKKHDIPWIADLRDLWTQNPYYQYTFIRMFFERKMEFRTLSQCRVLITTTKEASKTLGRFHRQKSIYSIPNGFDPQSMNISNEILSPKFEITYTGNLYAGKRDPNRLFKALNELILEQKMDAKDISVRFYGRNEDWLRQEIEDYQLKNIVHYCGRLDRNEIMKIQKQSQILLLLIWDHPDEKNFCPGKIYEYLAAKRPILAIGGQKGALSDLLSDTMSGVHTTSVSELKSILENYYNAYKLNGYVPYNGKNEVINKYSQREMAKRYSVVLNKIAKSTLDN